MSEKEESGPQGPVKAAKVTEMKTKVVDPPKDESLLKKGEMLVIHCNLCERDQYFGRRDREGNIKPDADCVHHTFLGVKKFESN